MTKVRMTNAVMHLTAPAAMGFRVPRPFVLQRLTLTSGVSRVAGELARRSAGPELHLDLAHRVADQPDAQ